MTEYRSSFPINKYKSIKGTLTIHQVTTTSNDKSIMAHQCSCGCKSCLNNEEACESIAALRDCEHLILLHSYIISMKKAKLSVIKMQRKIFLMMNLMS